jgi:hypothetical protein
MAYVRLALSGLAAALLAALGPWFLFALKGMSEQRAIGVGAIAGGFFVRVFSPWFWVLALSLFMLFYAASRLANRTLRIVLFWTPTVVLSTLGVAVISLFALLWIHSRSGG